jgi:hypothetical protein
MTSSNVHNVIRINRACSDAAIREEIGVRMRIELAGEHDPLPQRLVTLMDAIRIND